MSDGLIAFLGALFVAGLSGETIIAYRHPKEFGYLATVLIAILCFALLYMQGWDLSNQAAKFALDMNDFKDYAAFLKSQKAIEAKQFDWWYFWIGQGTLAYTAFLNTFQSWLVKPKNG